jgi:hypothetical protein
LISEPPFPSWEWRFFLLAPSRQGLDSNERRKKRKTRARGFEKKFVTFPPQADKFELKRRENYGFEEIDELGFSVCNCWRCRR